MKARRSGLSIDQTSVKPRVGERPSWRTRWVITSGLFSGYIVLAGVGVGVVVEGEGRYRGARRPCWFGGRRLCRSF